MAHHALSPLHAEALAALLASKINKALDLPEVSYASDNQILSKHTAARQLRCPLLYEFKQNNHSINYTTYKIKRDQNTSAHGLAAQALWSLDSNQCAKKDKTCQLERSFEMTRTRAVSEHYA